MATERTYKLLGAVGNWEVYIAAEKDYGYFEHVLDGSGGGLWFEGKNVSDYDGVYELPKNVIKALMSKGYHMPGEF